MELPREEDRELIADFILNWSNEGNGNLMPANTKQGYITSLVYLARFLGHVKSFKEMTRQDIVDGYLNSLRVPFHEDINQKWCNTFNKRLGCFLGFWKWWSQPDLKREERQTPPQLKGVRPARKGHKTSTRREHLWTPEEHLVFLSRCENLRLACYHAIAIETGGRPSEILNLKISDIKVGISPTGKQYSDIYIGQEGKMREDREHTLVNSIPHFTAWVAVHPARDSPEGAYLFPSQEKKSMYKNKPLKVNSIRLLYVRTIKEQFPKLLLRQDISQKEKMVIKGLLQKPCHPYLNRYHFGSEIFDKVSPTEFNQLMGHSPRSRQYETYVKAFGNEGNRKMKLLKGVIREEDTISEAQKQMQPKTCPICHTSNKQSALFCQNPSCNFIISQQGYLKMKEEEKKIAEQAKRQNEEITKLKEGQRTLIKTMSNLGKCLLGETNSLTIDLGDDELNDTFSKLFLRSLQQMKEKEMTNQKSASHSAKWNH
jgi:hypothetical protein